jgi:Flp pilus assembly protein TadG
MDRDGAALYGVKHAMKPGQNRTSAQQTVSARRRREQWSRGRSGQAMVEFALASILFFTVVLGAIDFGRAIYIDSQLTNAVREGARYAQVAPGATSQIQLEVVHKGSGLGLKTGDVTVSCTSNNCTTGNNVTVRANLKFSFFTQQFLGIGPFTMHAQATNAID